MRLQSIFCLVILSSFCTFWLLMLFQTKKDDISDHPDVATYNSSSSSSSNNNHDPLIKHKSDRMDDDGNGDGNGIIFFIHIPKTGGTTIRDTFSNSTQFLQVEYIFVNSLKQFRSAQLRIKEQLSSHTTTKKKILFVEVHGHNTPTLIDLETPLRTWKQQANKDHIPIFVFTLLREPIDLAVSFFNFFHVFGDKRFGSQMEANVQNLRQTLQWNPQCLYLYAGERPYFRSDKYYNVTEEDCHKIESLLWDNQNPKDNKQSTQSAILDWVGATNQLSTETLPLLVRMVTTGNMQIIHTMKSSSSLPSNLQSVLLSSSNVAATRRQRNRPLSKSELDAETIQDIHRHTQLDQKLYKRLLI